MPLPAAHPGTSGLTRTQMSPKSPLSWNCPMRSAGLLGASATAFASLDSLRAVWRPESSAHLARLEWKRSKRIHIGSDVNIMPWRPLGGLGQCASHRCRWMQGVALQLTQPNKLRLLRGTGAHLYRFRQVIEGSPPIEGGSVPFAMLSLRKPRDGWRRG